MTRSEPLARPAQQASLPGAPPGPPGAGTLGPAGVWPPPRSPAPRARQALEDPPTVPLPPQAGPRGSPESSPAGERAPERLGRVGAVLRRLAPRAWRGARVDAGRPGATALALVAAAAAVVAAVGVWFERPRAEPVSALPEVGVVAAPGSSAAPASGPQAEPPAAPAAVPTAVPAQAPAVPLVVAVSGKVQRPGLVEVPEGARVADVLEAAGGALPGTDLAGLNLARRVVDGEQVAVGVPPAPDAVPAGPGGPGGAPADAPGAPAAKVDLNTATADQLDTLPGVGPVTVERILQWRGAHGRFARVEQLREVEGIGERRFAQLRELVTV